jgi:DNA-binding NtrC family response regulator
MTMQTSEDNGLALVPIVGKLQTKKSFSANEVNAAAFKLLVIDDDELNLELIRDALQPQDDLVILATTDPAKGLALFRQEHPEVVLVDLKMPTMDGIELLELFVQGDPIAEVILMTGYYAPESAVEAIQKGASDYLAKPLDLPSLQRRIAVLLDEAKRRRRALQLDRELLHTFQFQDIVGRSPRMLDLFATIRRVAPHFRTALVTGDTGTGKELVAQALHRLSPVGQKTFAVCNCSALTETLFESELFGYVRGAFTGATQDKIGLFEYAQGGTVFLDEIGDMPLAGQAKLLRVLQNQEVQRVGSPAVRRVDVRVIAATNRDLRAMVNEKTFREDLFYRLSMVEINLPLLSERREDLPLLQRHFLEKFSAQFHKNIRGLTRRAQLVLSRYGWPGNVRELENVIGNACMMVESEVVDVADLPPYVRTSPGESSADDDVLSIDELQRRHVISVVQRLGGNKQRAAEMLGISRTTLYSILSKAEAAN